MNHLRLVTSFATSLASLSMVVPAFGAGYGVRTQSASHMGTAFSADGVGTGDVSAIFSNPAALGTLVGQQHTAGVALIQSDVKFSEGEATNGPLGRDFSNPPASTTADDITSQSVIPFVYGGYEIDESLKFGWSFTVPWATKTSYDDNWIGRYHGVETDLRAYNFSPIMSYQLNPKVTIAGGLQAQYVEGKLSSATDVGLLVRQPGGQDGMATFEADGFGYGGLLGVLARFDEWDIGFSYRSSVKHKLKGDAIIENTQDVALALNTTPIANYDGETTITTPDVYTAGVAFRPTESVKVYTNATLTQWSVFEELDLKYDAGRSLTEQNWKDSLYLAVGTEYQVNDQMVVRGGLALEEGSVEDQDRTPRTPDSDRRIAAVGSGYRFANGLTVDASYSHIQFAKSRVKLRADSYEANNGRGDLNGAYESRANVFMLQSSLAL